MTEWVFIVWLVVEVNGREVVPRVEVHTPSVEACTDLRDKALKYFPEVEVGPCEPFAVLR